MASVKLSLAVRRQPADDSMVHATVGLRPPATARRARIPTVSWTIGRRRYRAIVNFRLRTPAGPREPLRRPGASALGRAAQPSALDRGRRCRESPAPAWRCHSARRFAAHRGLGRKMDLGRLLDRTSGCLGREMGRLRCDRPPGRLAGRLAREMGPPTVPDPTPGRLAREMAPPYGSDPTPRRLAREMGPPTVPTPRRGAWHARWDLRRSTGRRSARGARWISGVQTRCRSR
jgi:hypothetical protein